MLDANDELLTPEQVEIETKVKKATLADWRVRGGAASPPFVKMGKRVLYPRSKLRSWLADRLRNSTSDPGPAKRAA